MNSPHYLAHLEGLAVFAADGQAVMFDPRDGGLHLLAELPWAVVEALQQESMNTEALKRHLHVEYPDDDAAEQAAAIDTALKQLLDLGLLRTVGA